MKRPVVLRDLGRWRHTTQRLLSRIPNNAFITFLRRIVFRQTARQRYGVDLLNRLFRLMNQEKPYLNTSVSIDYLASRLGVSACQLAQVINENLEQSFMDLIATYRIQEAKRMLVSPEYRNLKMSELARKVGYDSKMDFFEAFKKITEQTPTEYKKKTNLVCM